MNTSNDQNKNLRKKHYPNNFNSNRFDNSTREYGTRRTCENKNYHDERSIGHNNVRDYNAGRYNYARENGAFYANRREETNNYSVREPQDENNSYFYKNKFHSPNRTTKWNEQNYAIRNRNRNNNPNYNRPSISNSFPKEDNYRENNFKNAFDNKFKYNSTENYRSYDANKRSIPYENDGYYYKPNFYDKYTEHNNCEYNKWHNNTSSFEKERGSFNCNNNKWSNNYDIKSHKRLNQRVYVNKYSVDIEDFNSSPFSMNKQNFIDDEKNLNINQNINILSEKNSENNSISETSMENKYNAFNNSSMELSNAKVHHMNVTPKSMHENDDKNLETQTINCSIISNSNLTFMGNTTQELKIENSETLDSCNKEQVEFKNANQELSLFNKDDSTYKKYSEIIPETLINSAQINITDNPSKPIEYLSADKQNINFQKNFSKNNNLAIPMKLFVENKTLNNEDILEGRYTIFETDLEHLIELRNKISVQINLFENEKRRKISNIAPFIIETATSENMKCSMTDDIFQNTYFNAYMRLSHPEIIENTEKYVIHHLNASISASIKNKADFLNLEDFIDIKYTRVDGIQIPTENHWSEADNSTFRDLLKDGNKRFDNIAKILNRKTNEVVLHYYRTKKNVVPAVKRRAGRISDEDMRRIIKNEWDEKSISLFIRFYENNGKNWDIYKSKFPSKTERDFKLLYRFVSKYNNVKPHLKKERVMQNERNMKDKYLKEFTISQRQIFALYYPFVGRNWSEMAQVVNKSVCDIRGYYRHYFKKLSPEEKRFESNLQDIQMRTYSCPASPKRNEIIEHKESCGILFIHKKS